MPAYAVFIREHTLDRSELDAYAAAVGPLLKASRVKVLAISGRQKAIEGPEPEAVVILEFQNFEQAAAWYGSPAYQAIAQHRLKGGTYRGFILEGVSA